MAPKICGLKCEVYQRVVGYFRPVQRWNNGKKAEYADRVPFRVEGEKYGFETTPALAPGTEGRKNT